MSAPDPFEEKLRSLPARSLPPEWRAEILGRAASARSPTPRWKGLPHWLAWGWGAGIAASLALHLTTPEPALAGRSQGDIELQSKPPLQRRAQLLEAWLAFNDVKAYPKP